MAADFARRFVHAYEELQPQDRRAILQAVDRLPADRNYPSLHLNLHLKKMEGVPGIWEARAFRDLRLTCRFAAGNVLVFRTCGRHDTALKHPQAYTAPKGADR